VPSSSQIAHWHFYPFPVDNVTNASNWVGPQDYLCVQSPSETWTFHLDTFSYTPGCVEPPAEFGIDLRPCDAFLYSGAFTDPSLYLTYGKADACGLYGKTIVGIVHGHSPAGIVVCAAASDSTAFSASHYCGEWEGDLAVPLRDRWQFTKLPIHTANIDSATFDTAAGTACITADGQPFTFTLATRAFTAGCAAP
jgi:hypothetical protein